MDRLRRVGDFAYDFLVGDDWRLFAGSVAVMVAIALLAHAGLNAWWLAPIAVAATLVWSLRAATAGGSTRQR